MSKTGFLEETRFFFLETMLKREFSLEHEYPYNRRGAVRWIYSHALRYPHLPLFVIVTAILNNWAFSFNQVMLGRVADVLLTPDWQQRELLVIALAMLGLAVVQSSMGLLRNFSVEILAQRIERDAREELYVSLLGKSQTFHGRQRIGDIMARATNDVRSLNLMFSPGLMLIIDSAMATMVPIVLISLLEWRLLLIPLIFLVLLVTTVIEYNQRLKPVSMAQREQFGVMNAGLAEMIAGIEVIKANAREHEAWRRFMTDAREYRKYFVKQGEIQARYWPMLMFIICQAGALGHALWLWRSGTLSLGTVIAFMGLMNTLRFPTFISLFSFNLVQLGVAGAQRILSLITTETELDQNQTGVAQPIQGKVTFEHVSFSYNGAPVLKDISFTASPGETVAIVGQTGSGKTTLTQLINCIFAADQGRVLVDEIDVCAWSLESLRSQISTIEQDVFLFSRTLAENIAFGCAHADQAAIQYAAQEAQAHDFIIGLNAGYETLVGERGVTLSGGQRQRIAIARAFLTNPRILILDDSTSAIDSATEDHIQRAMRRISRDRTTFMITHRLSQIRWADRILVLRRGKLIDQGTHEDLMERCADYRHIFARYE
ncbi:MAG: ABC transporter ATP-binding protein [Candidatus Vecturithrix sp.]|jgi:ATP-binding cassette subfamily B protein|nr:ABC transporter ATP-binding protein [Candidatus Vecturithrix sp.]